MGGCNDCHTPMKFDPEIGMPVPDMTRMLSGHPEGAPDPASAITGHDQAVIGPTFTSFKAPFGIVYTANLTPEPDTGLGNWTEEMFVRAVRTGRHMGGNGRPILPPMPWPNVGMQSDADLKAIFAYLRSIPAIRNDVPAPKVPDEVMNGIAASYDKLLAKMKGQAAAAAPAANQDGRAAMTARRAGHAVARSSRSMLQSISTAKRPRPRAGSRTSGHFCASRWRSRMRRLSRLSRSGGSPSPGSSRSSRLENSTRPLSRYALSSFHRIRPGTLRIRYSPSTNTQSSFW